MSNETPSLPGQSRIELVESTDERLVLDIHPGNERTTRMGCGVLVGVIFVCYLSRPHVLAHFQRGQVPDLSRLKFYLYFAGCWVIVVWGLAYRVRLHVKHVTIREFVLSSFALSSLPAFLVVFCEAQFTSRAAGGRRFGLVSAPHPPGY